MEVKPGYKHSEVGLIPEDWAVCSLGTLATMVASGRSSVGRVRGNYPVHGSTGIIGYTARPEYEGESILVARVGANAGKLNFVSGKYGVTDNTIILRLRDNCCLPFFWRQLEAKRLNNLVFGSGQPLITGTQLKALPLSIPPLPEQHAIVDALRDADALLNGLEGLIAKKRDLKQAAMQQLLTGQTRLPGFGSQTISWNHSVFGQFPNDWEMVPLSRVSGFITKGSTPTTYGFQWVSSGVLFLRSECVSEEGLDLSESMFITPDAHRFLRRSEVKAGDILVTITGNVGRVVYLGNEFRPSNINQHIARIRIADDRVVASFIFHFLSQPLVRKYYAQITTGQAYPQISLTQVRDTVLPMPPPREQAAIAEVLTGMDEELEALEQRREKTSALKQAMMQQLLTGKIRLT